MGKTLLSYMCGKAHLALGIQFVFEGLTGEVEVTGKWTCSMMGHRSTLS